MQLFDSSFFLFKWDGNIITKGDVCNFVNSEKLEGDGTVRVGGVNRSRGIREKRGSYTDLDNKRRTFLKRNLLVIVCFGLGRYQRFVTDG